MKHNWLPLVRSACIAAWFGSIGAAAATPRVPSLPQDPPAADELVPLGDPNGVLPDVPGRADAIRICTRCHVGDRVASKRQLRAEWEETVQMMITRGAKISDEDFATAIEYLVAALPLRINVNTATAEEISAGFGLKFSDAQAVVAYREANGKFASLEDLRKIPDIEFKRIQIKREAVLF